MGMSSHNGRSGRTPMSEINVTPFVDVMLVLLIIFMVSAPLLTKGVAVDLPNAQAPSMDIQQEKLLLTVAKDKKIFLGQVEIPYERLSDTLLHNERLKREKELYVFADEQVPYGLVAKVLAIIRKAGIEKLGLVTDPLHEE